VAVWSAGLCVLFLVGGVGVVTLGRMIEARTMARALPSPESLAQRNTAGPSTRRPVTGHVAG